MKTETLKADVAMRVLDAVEDALIVVDGGGLIIFANDPACLLFGYEQGEMPGLAVEQLVPPDLREAHVQMRRRYEKRPRSRPLISGMSLKAVRKSGETFEAEIALTPIASGDDTVVAATVREVPHDIASEAYFRSLLESAPDAMIIVDPAGKISVINNQAEKLFGYDREELLGRDVETLLPARFRERHLELRGGYTRDPRVRPMGVGRELVGLRKNGTEFAVEISLAPVRHAGHTFVSSVIRDVTARRRMEADLVEARQAAERANKANTAFLAAASHDLRQPVQALSLLNGALRRSVDSSLALEMLESQQQSLDAMTNLLNSLLDISRLDAGAIEPEIEEFPIQRLTDRLSGEFARQATAKGLTFTPGKCDAVVQSDPNLLGEIIQNLVSNAIRYTDKGEVTMRCAHEATGLRLEVRDTGIGIEEDQLEEIFKEFHQCKRPGAEQEGFGLGLAIVRRMADLLSHQITVESEPGRGSCFSIHLPVVAREAAAEAPDRLPGRRAATDAVGGTMILIEDDVAIANAWAMLLETEGIRVAIASSAPEARAIIKHLDHAPDLVVSDYHLLDGSTGVDAVKEIRATFERDIPAFIVSGDTSKVVESARSLDNAELMAKPVNTDVLLHKARRAIANGRVDET